MGADHLLLVKSMRFREEYKRFYLRDVQAIVVAKAPRFHISTRSLAIGAVWLAALAMGRLLVPFGIPSLTPYLWVVAVLLVAAWAFISATCSCRCRIYTAVSSDDLPSVYRTWTARKFLSAVEPKIAEVQGVLEGEWAEAAEVRDIGPPLSAAPGSLPGLGAADAAMPAVPAPVHTGISDAFVAVLFASGLSSFLTLDAPPGSTRWLAPTFMILKVGLGVGVFVQHYKGKLASGMQKVAIAALMAMGVMYYVQQVSAGLVASQAANRQSPIAQIAPVMVSGNRLSNELNGGISLVLGCVGLGIVLLARESRVR